MNNEVRDKLTELIKKFGTSLSEDESKLRAILKDVLNKEENLKQVNILLLAVREGITRDLNNNSIPAMVLIPQLIKRLTDNLGMEQSNAQWVVETWTYALGVNNFKNDLTLKIFESDLDMLENYDLDSIINNKTIIIVVGASIVPELLDRPLAEKLRNVIYNKNNNNELFKRAIIINDIWLFREQSINLFDKSIISLGGISSNSFTEKIIEESKEHNIIYNISSDNGINRLTRNDYKRVALFGDNAKNTKRAVEDFINYNLEDFINFIWN